MRRTLVIIGIVVLVAGLAWPWLSRLPLGRLPGDVAFERNGVRIFLPVTTMIIVSLAISALLWLFRR